MDNGISKIGLVIHWFILCFVTIFFQKYGRSNIKRGIYRNRMARLLSYCSIFHFCIDSWFDSKYFFSNTTHFWRLSEVPYRKLNLSLHLITINFNLVIMEKQKRFSWWLFFGFKKYAFYTSKLTNGSVALLWRNAKHTCKFANKRAQANAHCSKWLSPGFTLHFVFRQSKATEPILTDRVVQLPTLRE